MDTGYDLNENQPRAGMSGKTGIFIGMGIGVLLSLLCLALIAGIFWVNNTDTTADCKKRAASISDVLRVQTFAPGIFERPVWSESFSSSPNRISKTWSAGDLSAVSYLEYLVYNCGYEQADIDKYFSDENFKTVLFQNYQDVTKTAQCSLGDLQHFEFTANYNKKSYLIYYWVKQDGSTRILDFMLAFPETEKAALNAYARRVYADLANCE